MTINLIKLSDDCFKLEGVSSFHSDKFERWNLTERQVFALAETWHLNTNDVFDALELFDVQGDDVAYFGILGNLVFTSKLENEAYNGQN